MILSLEEWVPAYTQRSKHLGDLEVLTDSFFFLTRKSNFIFYLFSYPFICGKINPLFIVCVYAYMCTHACGNPFSPSACGSRGSDSSHQA